MQKSLDDSNRVLLFADFSLVQIDAKIRIRRLLQFLNHLTVDSKEVDGVFGAHFQTAQVFSIRHGQCGQIIIAKTFWVAICNERNVLLGNVCVVLDDAVRSIQITNSTTIQK